MSRIVNYKKDIQSKKEYIPKPAFIHVDKNGYYTKLESLNQLKMEKEKTEPEKLFEMVSGRPYTLRRKRLHKGKFAPVGSIFIEVSAVQGKRKITSVLHIKGSQKAELEYSICESMFEEILKKFSE